MAVTSGATAKEGRDREPGVEAHRVSIIVPLRDDEERVEQVVAGIAAQDFVGELEVLVADGRSSDRSVERLRAAAARAGLALTVVDNPGRLIPHGLNACLAWATGDVVVRMDCRAGYPRDYVRRCLETLTATGAWNVGGVIAPQGRSRMQRAVACAADSPFGGIGWTRHGRSCAPVDVDTVYCGVVRRGTFERVGLFDEALPWNEDDDFNHRVRRAGGRVMLDPTLRIAYLPRGSLGAVLVQHYRYGRGKVDLMRKHRAVESARSLAPLTLVGSLGGLGVGATRHSLARRLLGGEIVLYAGAGVAAGARAVARRGEPWSLLPAVVAAFATMHVGYGAGMAHGAARAAAGRRRRSRASMSAAPTDGGPDG